MKLKLQENKKKKSPLRYIAFGAAFFMVLFFAVFSIANNSSIIAEKEAQYQALQNEIEIAEMSNKELEQVLGYSDEEYLEYVLSKAHNDLGYIRQGERVFEIVSGD